VTGAMQVSLTDPQGQTSNNNMLVTALPTVGLSTSTGDLSTQLFAQGSGLHPPSATGLLTVTAGGASSTQSNWSDTSIPVNPRNQSTDVVLAFNKSLDIMRQVRTMLQVVRPESLLIERLAAAERRVRRGIVESISPRHAGRLLKRSRSQATPDSILADARRRAVRRAG